MDPRRSSTTNRRTVLAGVAAGLSSIGLAGCTDTLQGSDASGDSSDDPDSSTDESDESDESDDTGENGEESSEVHEEYESTEVSVVNDDGDELGEVTAAIADTPELQQLGLSDTEELPEDRGMLFVYETVQEMTYGMPDMSFGIDIVFADDEGVITSIHNAPEPEPGDDESDHHYTGEGQYVLEVVYEWTDERGVEEGDRLEFDL